MLLDLCRYPKFKRLDCSFCGNRSVANCPFHFKTMHCPGQFDMSCKTISVIFHSLPHSVALSAFTLHILSSSAGKQLKPFFLTTYLQCLTTSTCEFLNFFWTKSVSGGGVRLAWEVVRAPFINGLHVGRLNVRAVNCYFTLLRNHGVQNVFCVKTVWVYKNCFWCRTLWCKTKKCKTFKVWKLCLAKGKQTCGVIGLWCKKLMR